MRERIRFEAVFAPLPEARARLDDAARARGWETIGGAGPRYTRSGADPEAALTVDLRKTEGWCTFTIDIDAKVVDAHGWAAIEDLLVGCCEAVGALLGRSAGPDGFPRLEPWELTGAVDAVDAMQWLGPALSARRGLATRRLTIAEHRPVGAAFWLRVVSEPFDDPSDPADRLARSFGLALRRRPPAVVEAVEAARRRRSVRAARRTDDADHCVTAVRARIPSASSDLDRLLGAADTMRDRAARHVRACLEHYGVDAIAAGLPVAARAAPALLQSIPEDVIEAVARVLAWRPPSGRRLIETVVSLEHWLESAENAPGILRYVLQAQDPDLVDGAVALDLMDVRRCSCDGCADRRRRLAEAPAI